MPQAQTMRAPRQLGDPAAYNRVPPEVDAPVWPDPVHAERFEVLGYNYTPHFIRGSSPKDVCVFSREQLKKHYACPTLAKRLARRDPDRPGKWIDADAKEVAAYLKQNESEGEYDPEDWIDSLIEHALSNGAIRPTTKPCTPEGAGPMTSGRVIKRISSQASEAIDPQPVNHAPVIEKRGPGRPRKNEQQNPGI